MQQVETIQKFKIAYFFSFQKDMLNMTQADHSCLGLFRPRFQETKDERKKA